MRKLLTMTIILGVLSAGCSDSIDDEGTKGGGPDVQQNTESDIADTGPTAGSGRKWEPLVPGKLPTLGNGGGLPADLWPPTTTGGNP